MPNTDETPLSIKLAEELDEGWTQKRPGEHITDYIDSDDGTLKPLLSNSVDHQFNGNAYELAHDCVNSAHRADGDYEQAKRLLRKEFSHLTTELQAAADGIGATLDPY